MPKGGRKQTTTTERKRENEEDSEQPDRERENVSQSEKLFCHTARLVAVSFTFLFAL